MVRHMTNNRLAAIMERRRTALAEFNDELDAIIKAAGKIRTTMAEDILKSDMTALVIIGALKGRVIAITKGHLAQFIQSRLGVEGDREPVHLLEVACYVLDLMDTEWTPAAGNGYSHEVSLARLEAVRDLRRMARSYKDAANGKETG